MNVIEATGLGRRFGRHWATRDIDLAVPEHSVVGLVGPNGAGKSTLLHLASGLIEPTAGSIRTLGGRPANAAVLPDISFVAQDAPLPRRARLSELVTMARKMNTRWDDRVVTERCDELGLRADQRVGTLSGGQRAQLALALALAKQPRLVMLDEPVASLDPLARRAFLRVLMAAVAERELTVVFSTHLLDDLERTCDHLIVLGQGTVRLTGAIDDIVARHAVLVGPVEQPLPGGVTPILGATTQSTTASRPHQQLVTLDRAIHDPRWQQLTPALEEIVLAHLAVEQPSVLRPPARRLEVV